MSYASVIIPKPGHPTIRTPFLTVLISDGEHGNASVHLHLTADEFRALAAGCIKAAERMERAAQTEPAGEAA